MLGNRDYFIAAKVVYESSHGFDTTNNEEFGKIIIKGVTVEEDETLTEDLTLFSSPVEQLTLSAAFF